MLFRARKDIMKNVIQNKKSKILFVFFRWKIGVYIATCLLFLKVKLWITHNEPWVVAWQSYGIGTNAPGVYSPDVGAYNVAHILIKSHAEAWHTYDTEFRAIQNGNGNLSVLTFCTKV